MGTNDRLRENLERKISLLSRLESVLREEREAIVSLDLARMEETDARKREVIRELDLNGEESRTLLREGVAAAGLSPESTLSVLLGTLPPPEREQLQRVQAEALEKGRRVDREITVNRELLVSSLRTVNASLDFFHRMFTLGTTYGEGGKISGESGVRLVSREA